MEYRQTNPTRHKSTNWQCSVTRIKRYTGEKHEEKYKNEGTKTEQNPGVDADSRQGNTGALNQGGANNHNRWEKNKDRKCKAKHDKQETNLQNKTGNN